MRHRKVERLAPKATHLAPGGVMNLTLAPKALDYGKPWPLIHLVEATSVIKGQNSYFSLRLGPDYIH